MSCNAGASHGRRPLTKNPLPVDEIQDTRVPHPQKSKHELTGQPVFKNKHGDHYGFFPSYFFDRRRGDRFRWLPSAFAVPTPGLLKTPRKWDMTADVVVAGSGIAGMCAATAAVDGGSKVIVFEKRKNYGGAAVINGGIMALQGGTKWQREHNIEDTPQRLYAHLTDPQNPEYKRNVPALVKKYSEYCGPTQ